MPSRAYSLALWVQGATCLLVACAPGSPAGTGAPDGATGGGPPVADGGSPPAPGSDGGRSGLDGARAGGSDAGPVTLDADLPPEPPMPEPECRRDGECAGSLQSCVAGYCRDRCLGDWCGLSSTGGICHGGYCVECRSDADCAAPRPVCDLGTSACMPVAGHAAPTTKIGLFYFLWHCPASEEVYDLSELSPSRWGPYGRQHYWDQPAEGYYCLSRNDGVLERHAAQIRDAGVDFVFLDVTNHMYIGRGSDRTPQMILEPLDRLLAVWSRIPGAPRIVPWVPVSEPGTDPDRYTIDRILSRLGAYPGMHFEYLGKPLILVTENEMHPVSESRVTELARHHTVRRMWAGYTDPGSRWSFLQRCQRSPLEGAACAQRSAMRDGRIEQVSITVAYQATYMSNTTTATPKHRGLTFRKQFQTLFDHPNAPIATITGWNEWIAGRQRCGMHPSCDCATFPHGCFVDTWDIEYNRDIEPATNEMGDYYYRLMRSCIEIFKRGERCDASTAGEVCCRDWAG